MSGSRIDEIVDAIADLGGGLGTSPFTVSAVFGAGSGLVADHLRPGQKVQPGYPGAPVPAPYSWFVMPPNSAGWAYGDATSAQITWTIEGRLFIPSNDLANAVRILTGFVNPFAKAFTSTSSGSPTLADTCAEQHITGTAFAKDDNVGATWLAVRMSVQEIVNLNA